MALKERIGVVVSNKMQETVVVSVEERALSPKYKKTVVKTKRFKAHDAGNLCKEGDRVRIQESRPLSKTKRWTVAEIVS
ncbi:MAG: 30S ribosomal protein S17 [Cyanobacteria bacterium J06641_5]